MAVFHQPSATQAPQQVLLNRQTQQLQQEYGQQQPLVERLATKQKQQQ
jgi:hypothetical protein